MAKKEQTFIASNYKVATLRHSDKWDGGTWFYIVDNGAWNEEDGVDGTIIRIKEVPEDHETVMLKIPGGDQAGANLPPKCYLDVTRGKVMTLAQYAERTGAKLTDTVADSPSLSA